MTKVNVISGFLGAGKTTLIKKLLAEAFPGEKLVLIENEFGEISIDGGFLKESGVQISEMSAGCICCSLVGDFGKALEQVMDQFHPDRILIEPSGVGKLSDVVRAVQGVAERIPGMVLGCAVTVADATKCKVYMKNFGEFYDNQIVHAGAIILSRTQKLSEEKLAEVAALLREKNPQAPIVTTAWDQLTGGQLLAAMEEGNTLARELLDEEEVCPVCGCHHDHDHEHHHHHHADEVFTSWGRETAHKYTEEELDFLLKALAETEGYGTVLRAKGIIQMTDGSWKQFDLVPGESETREGQPDYTGRVCVIGTDLKEDSLQTLFHI